jgi:pSer/pThr/pTyr-binding forkhead associated (FHA) protein
MYGDQWEYSEEPGDSPTGEMERISEPGAEVPVRALVRLGEGGELIYPLGRRTTIGRTADNNIQIDAPNVSRHHAVLLASDEHCRVEDLDSTNGVLVNGHRVTRQTLQDGDTVTIGKTEFRFMQRS